MPNASTVRDIIASEPKINSGVGAVGASATMFAVEKAAVVHRTTITLTDLAVTMTDEAGVVAHGGAKIYDLPAGAILILGASTDLTVVESGGINADFDGDFSIGTVVASNNNSLSTTEANIIASTALPQASGSATTADGVSTAVCFIDGTATAGDVYLNFLVDDADQDGGGTLTVNGVVELVWVDLGDN